MTIIKTNYKDNKWGRPYKCNYIHHEIIQEPKRRFESKNRFYKRIKRKYSNPDAYIHWCDYEANTLSVNITYMDYKAYSEDLLKYCKKLEGILEK